jgi:hypothetical protein
MIPAFLASYAIMSHIDTWQTFFQGDVLRTCFWCGAPFLLMAAYIPPVLMHMYEDWQVAPSRLEGVPSLPISTTLTDGNLPQPQQQMSTAFIQDYNNLRLRQVAQNVLFGLLGLSALMNHHALSGWQFAPLSLVMVVMACLGDQNHLVSQYIPAKQWFRTDEILLPVPVTTMTVFVYANTLQTLSYWNLATCHLQPVSGSSIGSDDPLFWMIQVALVLSFPIIGVGGAYEGLVTEAHFNQWDHLRGVLLMHAGFLVQVWALFQVGNTIHLV